MIHKSFMVALCTLLSVAPARNQQSGLEVRVDPPVVVDQYQGSISESNLQTHHFCGLMRAGNGNLIGLYGLRPDAAPPRDLPLEVYLKKSTGLRLSTDQGRTWSPQRELDYGGNNGGTLRDGTVLSPDSYTWWVNEHELRMVMRRSRDGGLTWSQDTNVRVRFPANRTLGRWDSVQASLRFYGNILPLDSQTLIALLQGEFAGSKQWHVVVIRSRDGGKSWEFVSCVAGDKPIGFLGFSEPSLVRLASGELLCVMRTEYHEPRLLEQCWSRDGGQTWSEPIAAPGIPAVGPEDRHYVTPDGQKGHFDAGNVSPMLALLGNGVLALTYGRPGIKVAFSRDGTGHHWDKIVEIVPKGAPYSYGLGDVTSGMSGLVPISRNELLLFYDIYLYAKRASDPHRNTIFARRITVRRDGN